VALLRHIKVAILAQNWIIPLLFVSSLLKEPMVLVLEQFFFFGQFSRSRFELIFKRLKKTYDFGFVNFFQIQEHSGLIKKHLLVPCTHYTLHKAENFIGMKH
jgi:hypothetical protein